MSTIDTSNVLSTYNALYGGALSVTPLDSTTFSRVAVENTLANSPVLPQGSFDTTGQNLLGTFSNLAPIIDAIEDNSTLATTGGPVGLLLNAYYTQQTSASGEDELLGSVINSTG